MYVCLCHGFTDRQVRSVAAQPERKIADVYRCLGGPPRCGKCVPMVRELVRSAGGDDTIATIS